MVGTALLYCSLSASHINQGVQKMQLLLLATSPVLITAQFGRKQGVTILLDKDGGDATTPFPTAFPTAAAVAFAAEFPAANSAARVTSPVAAVVAGCLAVAGVLAWVAMMGGR